MEFDPAQPYNELPPLPPIFDLETKAVLKKVAEASRSLAELKGLGTTIPNQAILVNSLVLREAKASSEIENIITTHDALYKAFTANTANVDPATKEVLRYRAALWEGFTQIQHHGLLRTNLFIDLVRIIKENQAGIRSIPGTVIRNTRTGDTLYTPPVGERVIRDLLRNLEEYLHGDDGTDPLIKVAVMHYQFEAIHPFLDGNGRVGRILNSLYIVAQGLLDVPILYLSKYIIESKNEYYRLLRAVTERGEWEQWIVYLLDAIRMTADETRVKVIAIRTLMRETMEIGKKELPDHVYSQELIEILFHQPYTKVQHLVDAGIAERKTASVYLQELAKAGILRKHKSGRENLYLNVRLFHLLSQ